MALRIRSAFEYLAYTLVVGGGLVALGADRASLHGVRDAALLGVFLGVVSFGMDMIVKRRAEISTRYAEELDPDFHVFRGWAAISWGVAFVLFAGVVIGFAVVEMTGWTAAEAYFRGRPGILVVLGGVIVAAFGAGSASRATYRFKDVERPARRLGDRIAGFCWLAVGLCIIAIGLLRTFAPAVLDAIKAFLLRVVVGLVPQ